MTSKGIKRRTVIALALWEAKGMLVPIPDRGQILLCSEATGRNLTFSYGQALSVAHELRDKEEMAAVTLRENIRALVGRSQVVRRGPTAEEIAEEIITRLDQKGLVVTRRK